VALNGAAVRTGVVAALPLIVPAAVVNAWLAGRPGSNTVLAVLTSLVLLLGFTFGGFAAARVTDTGTPLLHGAAGAAGAWAVLQAASIVIRLASGDGLRPLGIVFTGLLAASAGMVGGMLAANAPKRSSG
jgi:hypothetical protein